MAAWLASLNGALTLSAIAMLSFIGYALLVFRYVLDELMPGILGAVLQTIIVLLLIGWWIWSLISAISGSRGALLMVLICTSLPALFTLYDLIFHSPVRYGWPLVQISVWATFVCSLAAIGTLVFQLITSKPAA